jgi:molybdopterin converting factor small subunit
LRILLFGEYARRAGKSEIRWAAPRATTLRTLLAKVPELAGLARRRGTFRVAVNREFAALDTKVRNADEVALMPPFSGG